MLGAMYSPAPSSISILMDMVDYYLNSALDNENRKVG